MAGEEIVYFQNLGEAIDAIPVDSIVSRTFLREGNFKAILFAFDTHQELSEHTASVPAIIHILEGEADLTLGSESRSARAGTWVYVPAQLKHSIMARTPLKMLLLMLPQQEG